MPKKSRRIASRQAELSQRKRRPQRSASRTESTPVPVPGPVAQDGGAHHVDSIPGRAVPTSATAPGASRRTTPASPPSSASQRVNSPYIWPEIKRIGLLTGLVLIVLAVLTFLLR